MEIWHRKLTTALVGGMIVMGLLSSVASVFGITLLLAQPGSWPVSLLLIAGGIYAGVIAGRNWRDRRSGPVVTSCTISEVKLPRSGGANLATVVVGLPDGAVLRLIYNAKVCTITEKVVNPDAEWDRDRLGSLGGRKATIIYGRHTRSLALIDLEGLR